MYLLPIHVAAWVLRLSAVLPLWVLGFPIIAVLAYRHAWEIHSSRFFAYEDGSPRKLAQWTPKWAWRLYGNEEDGIAGPRWFMQGKPARLRAFVWSAWRNPVNNLRFVYPFGIRIDTPRVRTRANCLNSPGEDWTGRELLWSYTWQGVFAGAWLRVPVGARYLELRAGWKLIPRDTRMSPPDVDARSKGCGFGLQMHFRRT